MRIRELSSVAKIFQKLLFFGIMVLGLADATWAQPQQKVTYYYVDSQGSVLAEADENGQIVGTRDFTPFGDSLVPAAVSSPSYTGHIIDAESSFLYAQQRYYDPEVGRFLSVDPVGISAGVDRGLNRYWYGNNNPYRYTDPDGRVVTCSATSCVAESHSALEYVVDMASLGAIYTKVLIQNAVQGSQSGPRPSDEVMPTPVPEAGTADSDEGCIYCVAGDATPSGKPYVGSADDLGKRASTATDGRDRTNATKVDTYTKGDRTDRQNKEQKAINERGGKDSLDNKRNEVDPRKWVDRDIPPPPST